MKIMKPDYSFWQAAEVWTIAEAADLLLGPQPSFTKDTERELELAVEAQQHYIIVTHGLGPLGEFWTEEATKELISSPAFKRRKRFAKQIARVRAERSRLVALITKAVEAGKIKTVRLCGEQNSRTEPGLLPPSVIDWAVTKGLNVPPPLLTLIEGARSRSGSEPESPAVSGEGPVPNAVAAEPDGQPTEGAVGDLARHVILKAWVRKEDEAFCLRERVNGIRRGKIQFPLRHNKITNEAILMRSLARVHPRHIPLMEFARQLYTDSCEDNVRIDRLCTMLRTLRKKLGKAGMSPDLLPEISKSVRRDRKKPDIRLNVKAVYWPGERNRSSALPLDENRIPDSERIDDEDAPEREWYTSQGEPLSDLEPLGFHVAEEKDL